MATAKKTTAPKKSATSAKAAKPAPKKTTTASSAKARATASVPAGREAKLAEQALKLVDEAASVLRSGITTSAETTAKSRIAAKKRAQSLLDRASNNLTKALGDGTSVLKGLIGKI